MEVYKYGKINTFYIKSLHKAIRKKDGLLNRRSQEQAIHRGITNSQKSQKDYLSLISNQRNTK